MKYIELLWALDILSRYYPKYYSNDIFLLAEDIFKWVNNELPEDSSAATYLKSLFDSPADAFKAIWHEIQLTSGPFFHLN